MSKYEKLLILCLVVVTSFFVLYRLGDGSLKPWDEAWYGVISRNLLQPGASWLTLEYNANPFLDHPPLGFFLKAISMAILGETTFAVRLPEALLGVVSVVLVYLIGRRLSSPWAGLWGALILLSSRWFLFRARSGNLDVLLLATQLLVLFGVSILMTNHSLPSIKVAKAKKNAAVPDLRNFILTHRWLWLTWFFWSMSILAKSLISLQLAPLMVVTSWYYWRKTGYKFISLQTFWLGMGAFWLWVAPLVAWFGYQFFLYQDRYIEILLKIGFRSGTEKKIAWSIIKSTIAYFHAAVNKWFKIMIGSEFLAIGLIGISKKKGMLLLIVFYTSLVAFPYFISEKTEIWHLVPVVGAMAVLSGVVIDEAINQLVLISRWIIEKYKVLLPKVVVTKTGVFGKVTVTVAILVITILSLKNYWPEFLEITVYPEDYQKITAHLRHKDITLYTTMEDYFPGMVYYANLQDVPVIYLREEEFAVTCSQHLLNKQPLQIVARYGDWLMALTKDEYLIKREGNLVLVELSPEDCASYYIPSSI
jgi:4-amino-4-deoxy-L-arabinose transferase-like glycosyltransferase